MSIEVLTSCELSGLRRAICDQTATTYSDADLRGYVTDSLKMLQTKYVAQQFEVSGGLITPDPDYDELGIIEKQAKVLILESRLFKNAVNGGYFYRDPVTQIDTTNVPRNLSDAITRENEELDKMIRTKNQYKTTPVGKPDWQTSTTNLNDTSLNLNILENT